MSIDQARSKASPAMQLGARLPEVRLPVLLLSLLVALVPAIVCPRMARAVPEGRGWELVSPPNKEGAVIEPIFDGAIQSAEDGLAFTYTATAPIAGAEGYNGPEGSQFYSQRGESAWNTRDIATPHDEATRLLVGNGSEYRLFSPDLASAIVEPDGETPLAGATEYTPYLRRRLREPGVACTPCYQPLLTVEDVEPPGTRFGESGRHAQFLSATNDLRHIVLRSEKQLTADAAEHESDSNLYEWNEAAASLRLVSVLPDGKAATAESENATLGDGDERAARSISGDGSRVVWESGFSHTLYLRDMVAEKTISMSEVSGGSGGGGLRRPTFQTADPAMGRIFFTDEQRLTADSGADFGDFELYVFEPTLEGGVLAGKLADLTPPHAPNEAVAIQGLVLGASEDGEVIYYVAHGALTEAENAAGEKAVAGEDNLYVQRFDASTQTWAAPDFIASLAESDQPDWFARKYGSRGTASVSGNGRYLAFMSDRPLTGYDNSDAATGAPVEEVFLYDGSSGKLACVSCDPNGARPTGYVEQANPRPLVDKPGDWQEEDIAANIPDWVAARAGKMALYQPRYLGDDGHLFFNSFDGLTQEDTNAEWDVYEYQPVGVGGCLEEHETQAGGCVSLMSAGVTAGESALLDASAGGGDVFMLTAATLAPQDVDTALDVYDAHRCTPAAPCFPVPTPSIPCEAITGCRNPTGQPPAPLAAPASVAFSGRGTVLAQPAPAKPTSGRLARLRRELAACRRRRRRKQRRSCEAKVKKLIRGGAR